MWIFLPGGLLMPADVPMDLADPNFTEGIYDLQVRGRSVRHVKNFMEMYMAPGTFHDEVQLNPDMDYNCRFYTTREAFAAGLAKAVADIDYEKFKPTAEAKDAEGNLLYGTKSETATYHSVLNSIWGTVCRIGSPGGVWGPRSAVNDNGYRPVRSLSDTYRSPNAFIDNDDIEGYSRSQYPTLGSSFMGRDDELEFEDDMDWTPSKDGLIEDILREMEGIPATQWDEYLSESELTLVQPLIAQERRNAKRMRRTVAATKRRNKRFQKR